MDSINNFISRIYYGIFSIETFYKLIINLTSIILIAIALYITIEIYHITESYSILLLSILVGCSAYFILHFMLNININYLDDKDDVLSRVKVSSHYPMLEGEGTEDSSGRERATRHLDEFVDIIDIEALMKALKDENSDVRWRAAKALGKIKDIRTVQPLIMALKDENRDVRWRAARSLEEIVEPLIMTSKDEDSYDRQRAARLLGEIVEPLIMALKDENSDVRMWAAEAIGEIGDVRAIKPLIMALKDEGSYVRWRAAIALGKIGEPSVEALMKALKDENSDVRMLAAEALREIRDLRNIKPLKLALKDDDGNTRNFKRKF